MRAPAAIVLCALLLASRLCAAAPVAAGPAPAETAAGLEAEKLINELTPLRKELLRLQRQLQLAVEKSDPAGIAEVQGKRAPLRENIEALNRRLAALLPTLEELRTKQEIGAWVNIFSGTPLMKDVSAMVNFKDLLKNAERFNRDANNELYGEQLNYKLQLDEYQKKIELEKKARAQRAARLMIAGVLAVLALLCGGVFLLWRSQKKLASTRSSGSGPITLPGEEPQGGIVGGSYRIERELGRGAMGIVYEALDLTLQRKVALKKMREELQKSPKDLKLFLSEARMVAALKHPNIVEIHTVFQENGEVFLVFEHVSGSALSALLEDGAPVDWPRAREMSRQIGSALDYAHALKVIHRDLKPDNVMVLPDGSVKVMDFGIAHQLSKTVARQTRAESWGTPPYMAPEQELGSVCRESDLYALGVCVYEMATGTPPFEGPNFILQKREMHYLPATQRNPKLPAGLDGVIARALQPELKDRYHSAAELQQALDALA